MVRRGSGGLIPPFLEAIFSIWPEELFDRHSEGLGGILLELF
jgi:hypothetical protein